MKKQLTLIFIFITTAVFSQYNYKGKVVDAYTKKPISKTEIYIKNNSLVATTNANGIFEFTASKEPLTLTFFSLEYKILDQLITAKNPHTIQLQPLTEELNEIVITNRQKKITALRRLKQVEGTAIYAGKKSEVVLLSQIVGNKATNNARQIYSQITGLNIYENGDGGLQLNIGGRGLDPNRSANFNTRQNDYDISADVLGYPESYYTPPAEALSEIQVIRGAASLQYGTQFGGLVNFKLQKPPANKKLEFTTRQSVGSYGLFNSFNSLGGTVGKASYYAYYNYKKGDGYRKNSNYSSKNMYAFLSYSFTENTKLAFETTHLSYLAKQSGGLTDKMLEENPKQSNRNRNWFQVDWNLFSLKLNHRFNKKTQLSFNLFGLYASRKALGFRGNPYPSGLERNPITTVDEKNSEGNYIYNRDLLVGNFKNWGAEIRSLTKYTLGNKNSVFLIGAKYYQANNSSQQGAGSINEDADFSFYTKNAPNYPNQSKFTYPNKNIAVFSENIFQISDKISITPGIRFEYIKTESKGTYQNIIYDLADNVIGKKEETDFRTFERNFLLLGVGVSYKPTHFIESYANFSQNYRSVTFSDIRSKNPTFIIDPNITDEKGFTADIGIRGKWKNILNYDLGAYGILYDNRIGVSLIKDGPNKGDRERSNIGKAFIGGFESFLEWNLLPLFSIESQNFQTKWFTNLAITDSQYLKSKQANVKGNKVEFIPFINLKTGVKGAYKNVVFSVQYTYLSKQYTDATNAQVPYEGDERYGIIGEIPAYDILDISFSYRYKKWKLEAGVNNLLDKNYFTRRAEGYPGPGIIPSDKRSFYTTLQFKL